MKRALLPLSVFSLCTLAGAARADLNWTEVTNMGANRGQMSMTTTKWAKKDAQRSETTIAVGPMKIVNVSIERCDEGKRYEIAPDLKMYTVQPLTGSGLAFGNPMAGMGNPMAGMMGRAPRPDTGPKQSGTSDIEYNLQDLGTEKIADVDTHHYALSMKITSTGCAGNGTHEVKFETWVADIPMPAPCLAPSAEDAAKAASMVQSSCDVKTTFKGDTTALSKAFSGLVMRWKMNMGQQGDMVREVTMLSRAEQPDDKFTVPADWKQVSPQEFQQAKARAMMQSMMGGMPGMGGG
jgi:hypothetical protein